MCDEPQKRKRTEAIEDALSELPAMSMPMWLEREVQLPFSKLTGDEFEILCFLLLRAKFPQDRIYYYGKTSDMGRDIIHRTQSGRRRLIQCKNFEKNLNVSAIAAEMAKVYANVHTGKIPERPDEVVFFVSRDLSAPSQDLIEFQAKWLEIAPAQLKKFLKAEPPEELKRLSHEWWPFGDRQTGIAITEDVQRHCPELVEKFFTIRKVIDASRNDVREDVREELNSAIERFRLGPLHRGAADGETSHPKLSSDTVRSQFALASTPLSKWPQTLGNACWIERPESEVLLGHIDHKSHYACVLLGEPGSGKSALLAHLATRLHVSGMACLGIKADALSVNVDTLGKLAERLHLPATVADCVTTSLKRRRSSF